MKLSVSLLSGMALLSNFAVGFAPQRASVARATLRLFSTTEEKASKPIVNEDAYEQATMEDIVSLCKRRGFIFPSSEIYNGYAGFYDYGPIGSELKKNVKDAWWRHFVTRREDVVGLDSSIIHNPATWKSSGTFSSCL
jgi:glycyl-tRNA synthetase